MKMALTVEMSTTVRDVDGTILAASESTTTIPGMDEIKQDGFRSAFNLMETNLMAAVRLMIITFISRFWKMMSKRRTEEEAQPGLTMEEKPYRIECEFGSVETQGHALSNGKRTIFDSRASFFELTGSREAFKSNALRSLMLVLGALLSVRKATNLLDRIRGTVKGIIETTFRNIVEREGQAIQGYIEQTTAAAIEKEGISIDQNGKATREQPENETTGKNSAPDSAHIDAETVHEAAKRLHLAEGSYNPEDYEKDAVNISPDEVGVNRQTEDREPNEKKKDQPKKVRNTVIHVSIENNTDDPKTSSSSSYVLNGLMVVGTFVILLGFLCINGLLDRNLVFFVDGASNLHTAIANLFANITKAKVILDWYHLRKKMEQKLSLICTNKEYRNELLQKCMPMLWRRNIDGVIALLRSIDMKQVKDKGVLAALIEFLDGARAIIPNYQLRAALGLRNSSNRGEKANDLIVADRQKHNGMSWSDVGSSSLASVAALVYNNELDNWVNHGFVSLKLVERVTPIRQRKSRQRTSVAYENRPVKGKKTKGDTAA
jgi:hypothetical protein